MKRIHLFAAAVLFLSGCPAPTPATVSAATALAPVAAATPPALKPNSGLVSTVLESKSGLISVAIGPGNDIYVSDWTSIRRFTSPPTNGPWRMEDSVVVASPGQGTVFNFAVGPDGRLWWFDLFAHLVTQAASGERQTIEIPGGVDYFNQGVALDGFGNAYVASNRSGDFSETGGSHYIAKISPNGEVTPFAGKPGAPAGFLDGVGEEARFSRPGSLAFDRVGNLYVADGGNASIRRVTPEGLVTTVAGKGPVKLPPSPMPGLPEIDLAPYYAGTAGASSLTLDADGILYYAGSANRIYRIAKGGEQSVFAGDGFICQGVRLCSDVCPTPEPESCDRDGPAMSARFLHPRQIVAAPSGILYVVDSPTYENNYRLRQIQ